MKINCAASLFLQRYSYIGDAGQAFALHVVADIYVKCIVCFQGDVLQGDVILEMADAMSQRLSILIDEVYHHGVASGCARWDGLLSDNEQKRGERI